MSEIFIIAEIGVNHNGSRDIAMEMIDTASKAGVDAVKFQTFNTEKLVSKNTPKTEYQIKNDRSSKNQFDMLKKLELSRDLHLELNEYCSSKEIEFMSTAFDEDSLDFLVHEVGMKKNKIPSGELNNAPFLIKHGATGNKIILSTGMSSLKQIHQAISAIAFGFSKTNMKPSIKSFREVIKSKDIQNELRKKITLLHCTSQYPAPIDSLNLMALFTLKEEFEMPVGYSDHSLGTEASIAASAMGAEIIEKHFTLDNTLEGPDHKASLEPNQLINLVSSIRKVELMLGSRSKSPSKEELENKNLATKSIVAKSIIRQGEYFTDDNLTTKRPGDGMSPFLFWDLIGVKSKKEYMPDEQIDE